MTEKNKITLYSRIFCTMKFFDGSSLNIHLKLLKAYPKKTLQVKAFSLIGDEVERKDELTDIQFSSGIKELKYKILK